ncbi:MAG: prepilin peptidase, partial [Acidobacteria bacterium]|nr:prepilin peptidase [Acidobacteriota bacterium]
VFYAIAAAILGLLIGSFLNVVIHRVPLGESVIFPNSHCPHCSAAIRPMDNIPVISFLLLKGRCRTCHASISWRYPAVELLTAAIFIVIGLKSGLTWQTGLEMVFACVMISLVFIDAIHHLLPNVITYPAIVFALAAATARAGWGEPINYSFDISFVFQSADASFPRISAAVIGGLLLAMAAPLFWLLDWLDLRLYNKYFEWEDMNEEAESVSGSTLGEGGSVSSPTIREGFDTETEALADARATDTMADEEEAERRYRRTISAAMIFGLIVAATWAIAVLWLSPKFPDAFSQAYGGLWRAVVAALIGSVPIWWLRAAYFYIRGAEGMGLGDVKLMAIIGAFLGWQGAIGVLLFGSILGSVTGIYMAWRSQRGLKTALPFGVCLGIAALIVLLTAKPFFLLYL